jgi:predicted Fe-Mo cluster-binding NifX family protein
VKVAFTTAGTDLQAPLDPRFGRAPRFILYDLERDRYEAMDNQKNLDAAQGAGVQAAAAVARSGAQCVVTGHCGPKAYRVLSAAGVHVYLTDAATVAEALGRFRSGDLTATSAADVDGHWG